MNRKIIIGCIFLTAVWFVLYVALIVGRQSLYCCDNLLINIPAKVFLARELKSGNFPLWNPYIFTGMPFLADINLGILYPANLLYLYGDPLRVLTVLAVGHILFMSLGIFSFVRAKGLGVVSSLAAGIVGSFTGAVTTYTGNVQMLFPAAWLGWILFFCERWLVSGRKRWYLAAVASGVLQIFSGHPQITYLSTLLVAVYVLIRNKAIFMYLIPVFLIAGIQLVPTAEIALASTRANTDYAYASFGSVHPVSLISFVLPAFTGSVQAKTAWYDSAGRYGFTGILPVVFSIALIVSQNKLRKLVYLAVFFIVLSLGKFTPLYYVFYRLMPGLSLFRVPSHMLYPYTIVMALVTAYAFEHVEKLKKNVIPVAVLCSLFYGFLWALFSYVASHPSDVSHIILSDPTLSRELGVLVERGTLSGYLLSMADNALLYTLIITGAAFVVTRVALTSGMKKILIMALVVFDLLVYGQNGIMTQTPANTARLQDVAIRQCARVTGPQKTRMYVPQDTFALPETLQGKGTPYPEALWAASILRPNLHMLGGCESIDGYASLVPASLRQFFGQNSDPTGMAIGNNVELIGNAGAGYILDGYRNYEEWIRRGAVPFSDSDHVTVYTLPMSQPRMFVEKASIVQYASSDTDHVYASLELEKNSELVLLDAYYPGWHAYIDGREVAISRYMDIFRMVDVPAGTHTVEFSYSPVSVKIGIVFTCVGLFVLVSIALKEPEYADHIEKRKKRE